MTDNEEAEDREKHRLRLEADAVDKLAPKKLRKFAEGVTTPEAILGFFDHIVSCERRKFYSDRRFSGPLLTETQEKTMIYNAFTTCVSYLVGSNQGWSESQILGILEGSFRASRPYEVEKGVLEKYLENHDKTPTKIEKPAKWLGTAAELGLLLELLEEEELLEHGHRARIARIFVLGDGSKLPSNLKPLTKGMKPANHQRLMHVINNITKT